METHIIVGIIGAVIALFLGGVLSLVETAVSSISRARVEAFIKDDKPGASRLLKVVNQRAKHINLLVLLRTLAEVAGAVLGSAVLIELLDATLWTFVLSIGMIALITFTVVGVLSRTLGRQNPYTISLTVAPVLLGVTTLLGPIAKLVVKTGNIITPGKAFREGPFASEIELREMVDIASERGIVERDERRMIQSVFDLASTSARSVMVPRPEMVWIEHNKTAAQATSLLVRSGHSRLPVIGEDVDDIVGVVYLKDLVARTYHSPDSGRSVAVEEIMRKPVFVPDSRKLDDLLEDMQRDQVHIAMLVDEYGAIAGLLSIEDILEEIVGEIADEYDATEIAPIEDLGNGTYRVVARLSLYELEELFNDVDLSGVHDSSFHEEEASIEDRDVDWESSGEYEGKDTDRKENHKTDYAHKPVAFSDEQHDDVDTVAGLGAYELGRVPLPGAEVDTGGVHITFEGGRDRRGRMKIRSAIVQRSYSEEDEDKKEMKNGKA